MRLPAADALFSVFSEYPLTRRFNDRRIPATIAFCSLLTLIGLVIFNVMSQGYDTFSESVYKGRWYPKNKTVSCQTETIKIDNSYFTEEYDGHLEEPGGFEKENENSRGSFRWSIQSILRGPEGLDIGESRFEYQGGPLRCNITGIYLSCNFHLVNVNYKIGARCSTPSLQKNEADHYIGLATSFSSVSDNIPTFAVKGQSLLITQIAGFGEYYPQLNFSAIALSASAFLSNTKSNNPLAAKEVPNRDIIEWSVALGGFNYTLTDNYKDFNYSYVHLNPEPQGHLFLSPRDAQPTKFDQSIINLLNNEFSFLKITALGIGGIRPIPKNATLADTQRLPAPIPLYFNLTESIVAIMMDFAGKDLDKRTLETEYLCTISRTSLKNVFPMIAMLIGNCAGIFGTALTVMLFISRRFDSRMSSKLESRSTIEAIMPHSPLMRLEHDETNSESQVNATRREIHQFIVVD